MSDDTKTKLDEPILPDDYPMHAGYLYVVDGKPHQADRSLSVGAFKRAFKIDQVRRCDIGGRNLW